MNITLDLIFTITAALSVLVSAYGLAKSNRKSYLYGLSFFSLICIINQSIAYYHGKSSYHLLMFFLFIIHLALAFPNSNNYTIENMPAVKLATKIVLSFAMINIIGAIFAFTIDDTISFHFGCFHIIFILLIFYGSIKELKKIY